MADSTNISQAVSDLRRSFNAGKTRDVEFRRSQLKSLMKMYDENMDAFASALKMDLGKPRQESVLLEINVLKDDITYVLNHLNEWTKTETVPANLVTMFDKCLIYNDPYGVVLILGAWNYPVQLSMLPAAGAISAGNCVIIKPSEVSPATSSLLARLVPRYLDKECYKVIEGDIALTTEILKEKFDYIFFTGSTHVGKIVRDAANVNLTPTTLELGGKSPVYLDNSVNFDVAVRRILWGKLINAGQTCIAPDYLLCSKEVEKKFVAKAKEVLKDFYGDDPKSSPDLCRIVNDRHVERLAGYIKEGTVEIGGQVDRSTKYVAPTILTGVPLDSKVMTEEIFGPILPIVNVDSAYDAISFINERERPLVMYVFSCNAKQVDTLLRYCISGGTCINDVVIQLGVPGLPFGGVGSSGMGRYHGKYSFDTFTHRKSCLRRNYNSLVDVIGKQRYPPYSDGKVKFLSMALKERWLPSCYYLPHLLCFGMGAAVVALANYFKEADD